MSTKGKMTSKEEKSTKMKELLFIAVESNYLKFLQAILLKHGLESYKVTEKKHFPVKQWLLDMIDVNNTTNYKEMLPWAIKSSDDSECTSNSSKLRKGYKNRHDEGITYISPLGSIPLTPTMIQDWCLALEDGQATIATLPNIELLNMANKAPILHLMQKAAAQPTPTALDFNSLTLTILPWTLTQFNAALCSPTAPVTPMPQTPKWPKVKDTDSRSSPPIPSPSKLVHYLQFAESHPGVQHTMPYKLALEMHGFNPDILPDVSNKLLADLGCSAGDTICLKKGSIAWWNRPNANKSEAMHWLQELQGHLPSTPIPRIAGHFKYPMRGGTMAEAVGISLHCLCTRMTGPWICPVIWMYLGRAIIITKTTRTPVVPPPD
ncbi:hypothetical protein EV401DRAFT_1895814 [Pisolithus croceorrhizus]|nr:hypothetical protein EV401DRAFT_1895814 [Pisolithus croceorrhizus]